MRPIELGRDFFHDLVTGAKEAATEVAEGVKGAIYETVRRNGQNESEAIRAQLALAPDTLNRVQNAAAKVPKAVNEGADRWIFQKGFVEHWSPRPDQLPIMANRPREEEVELRPLYPNVSLAAPEVETLPGVLRRLKDGVDEYVPSAANAGRHSRDFKDEVVGLTGTVTGINEVIAATPGHIADVNASFAVTSGERLPEMIGQMGTLEDTTLAAVDALSLLAGAPPAQIRSRWASGGGAGSPAAWTSTPTGGNEHVASDPRYSPAEGESWEDYYYTAYNLAKHGGTEREKTLGRERAMIAAAKLGWPPPQFASGTAFAPGGLALVGEMGPELVNLPRGSQVIPNPRLGGEVHVHVTVQGSVVAERDLAQRIRQELIRTSRRTVDLGFSS